MIHRADRQVLIVFLLLSGCMTAFDNKENTDTSTEPINTDRSMDFQSDEIEVGTDSTRGEAPTAGDACPNDPNKTEPGTCGCGLSDVDGDGDGTPDCVDTCPFDPQKTAPGACGCGASDEDSDRDGTPDCYDECPSDPEKTTPGTCGCGNTDCQDACDPDDCIHGICVDEGDNSTCRCEDGWTGPNCDQNIDNCDPNPCVNGTCNDGVDSYSCDCESGWTGTNCDEVIDMCDPNPCVNGTCSVGVGSYSCDCDPGWLGENCDKSIGDYCVEGLKRTHRIDSDKDGIFETELCKDLAHVWFEDPHLDIEDRCFGFTYLEGTSPCDEIDPFDSWMSIFEGYLYIPVTEGGLSSIGVGFNADVNDGVRLILMDPAGQEEICRMELWLDVPEYWNYHSTDGYNIDYSCETTLITGIYYPVRLEAYHESDVESNNSTFNRGYLSMFYKGLPMGESVKFCRLEQSDVLQQY